MAEETKEKITEKKITDKLRENPWMVSTILLAVVVIVMIFYSFSGGITGNVVSESDIGDKAVDFFKTVQGVDLTVDSVEKVSGLYQLEVSTSDGQSGMITMSGDGNYVGTMNNIKLILDSANTNTNTNTNTQTPEMVKTDKPVVDLYVMSFCPYGNKAEDTLLPVYELLKTKVEWNMHYIVSVSGTTVNSLHGQPEVDQDMREACVLKDNGIAKWFSFISYVNANCGSKGDCWEVAASKAGLTSSAINSCVANNGLDLMKAEESASDAAGASGSPTMIINGVETSSVYQYGNSQAYLDAICSAFTTEPSECSQALSGTTATSTGGSC